MDTKQYLKQAYRINELIKSQREELETLKLLSTSVVTDTSQVKVQGSKQVDRLGNIVAKIVDMENQINEEIERCLDLKLNIHNRINNLPNVDERLVLRLRYLEFLEWDEITQRLSYSLRQIYRIHAAALANVNLEDGASWQ